MPRSRVGVRRCRLRRATVAGAGCEAGAERRSRIIETSRVYTNEDLRPGPRLTTSRTVPEAETDPARVVEEPRPPADAVESEVVPEETRDESYWRDRIESAQERLRRARLMVAALQNRVDGLWAEFTARDDPFQRAELERNRAEALGELQATRAEIERLDDEIRAIREEARRSGVPPGWLR